MKIEAQCEIDVYVSDANNLCIAFDINDLIEIDGKQVIIITSSNVEYFKCLIEAELKEINNNLLQKF